MQKLKSLLPHVDKYVRGWAKAWIGWVVSFIVLKLVNLGIEVEEDVVSNLEAGIYGFIVALWVWFVPNPKK